MPTPPTFSDRDLRDAASCFVAGVLAGIDPACAVDERAFSGSGISSYDRVGLFDSEMARAKAARRARVSTCEELARQSIRLRHARAA